MAALRLESGCPDPRRLGFQCCILPFVHLLCLSCHCCTQIISVSDGVSHVNPAVVATKDSRRLRPACGWRPISSTTLTDRLLLLLLLLLVVVVVLSHASCRRCPPCDNISLPGSRRREVSRPFFAFCVGNLLGILNINTASLTMLWEIRPTAFTT